MRTFSYWGVRVGGIMGVFWLLSVALFSSPQSGNQNESHALNKRFKKATEELDHLKTQNREIKNVLNDLTKQVKHIGSNRPIAPSDNEVEELHAKLDEAKRMLPESFSNKLVRSYAFKPSLDFELTRRQIDKDIQESYWYFEAQLKKLSVQLKDNINAADEVHSIREEGLDRLRIAQYDLTKLSGMDGMTEWRKKEAAELSDFIQARLNTLQNPTNCSQTKKLLCNLNKGCGYGCQIHHIAYCLIVAYGTQRTLILKSKGWRYNKGGWEDVFQPLSRTCRDSNGKSHSHWPGTESVQVIELPIVDTISARPSFLPLAIPEDLSERIIRLSGNPSAWWVGQILKYILKVQPKTQEMLDTFKTQTNFQNPVVGIHIRRTDKVGTEAAYHVVEEYMSHAEEYYRKLSYENKDVVKRVFVASDDPSVIEETKKKYPNYIVYGDASISKTAAVATRYTDASLKGIILDIHFLSLTDYIVCTFSSQVCRIAYEIMQSFHPDAAYSFRSLDDVYYYGGQNVHLQKARLFHKPSRANEMELNEGDMLSIAGNHWDGFSKGTNTRLKQTALYPSYKVMEVIDVAKMLPWSDLTKNNHI